MRRPPPDEHLRIRRVVMDADAMGRTLRRMTLEMLERNRGAADLVLVGIRTGGAFLAERLARLIAEVEGREVPVGAIDISLYRDDVFRGMPKPEVGPTHLPGTIEGRPVVLVDDVLYTGRTVRAALDELMEFGRPRSVQLAVLVDRGHRELPIQPDYVGAAVQTTRIESVRVMLTERGETVDQVVLREAVQG